MVLTAENKRDVNLSDSAALILDLNADCDSACLVHYRQKDESEKSLCQLK